MSSQMFDADAVVDRMLMKLSLTGMLPRDTPAEAARYQCRKRDLFFSAHGIRATDTSVMLYNMWVLQGRSVAGSYGPDPLDVASFRDNVRLVDANSNAIEVIFEAASAQNALRYTGEQLVDRIMSRDVDLQSGHLERGTPVDDAEAAQLRCRCFFALLGVGPTRGMVERYQAYMHAHRFAFAPPPYAYMPEYEAVEYDETEYVPFDDEPMSLFHPAHAADRMTSEIQQAATNLASARERMLASIDAMQCMEFASTLVRTRTIMHEARSAMTAQLCTVATDAMAAYETQAAALQTIVYDAQMSLLRGRWRPLHEALRAYESQEHARDEIAERMSDIVPLRLVMAGAYTLGGGGMATTPQQLIAARRVESVGALIGRKDRIARINVALRVQRNKQTVPEYETWIERGIPVYPHGASDFYTRVDGHHLKSVHELTTERTALLLRLAQRDGGERSEAVMAMDVARADWYLARAVRVEEALRVSHLASIQPLVAIRALATGPSQLESYSAYSNTEKTNNRTPVTIAVYVRAWLLQQAVQRINNQALDAAARVDLQLRTHTYAPSHPSARFVSYSRLPPTPDGRARRPITSPSPTGWRQNDVDRLASQTEAAIEAAIRVNANPDDAVAIRELSLRTESVAASLTQRDRYGQPTQRAKRASVAALADANANMSEPIRTSDKVAYE